jgi:glycosyltransferase involved in cell wall biosynthesis
MNALKFTDYFLRRGHDSACLCAKGSELHLNISKSGFPYYAVTIFSRYSPLAALKVRQLIRSERFQIVHLHTPRDLWLISPALWGLPRVKLFATSRIYFTSKKKLDLFHRLLYQSLDKLVNLSHKEQEHMQKNLPLAPEKHTVIPNPVDTDKFNPSQYDREFFRSQWKVKPDEILIGLVGRLDPGKGQREMILAIQRVILEFPHTKLVLVGQETFGEHQNFADELRVLAQQLGIADQIIWAGFQTRMSEVLKALDIFVMPSYQENFANILLEAMAMQLPIVSTNSGGTPEILDYGKCGLLVPPRQSEPLAEAVLSYLRDSELKNKMACAARKRAEQVYALEVVLDQLEELYYQSLHI